MNKFGAFLFLAFVAVASADEIQDILEEESQWSPVPKDAEETSRLTPEQQKYAQYCIDVRETVFGTITSETNGAASSLFNLLFSNAEQIVVDAVKTQSGAVSALGEQIAHPEIAVEGEGVVADARRAVQNSRIQPKSFFEAFLGTLRATKDSIQSNLVAKFEELKKLGNPALIQDALVGACNKVAKFEADAADSFEKFKIGISDDKYAYTDVHCTTKDRLVKLNFLCSFAQTTKTHVDKMFGRSN